MAAGPLVARCWLDIGKEPWGISQNMAWTVVSVMPPTGRGRIIIELVFAGRGPRFCLWILV